MKLDYYPTSCSKVNSEWIIHLGKERPRGAGWAEVGGRFKREGIHGFLQLIHVVVR